MSERIGLDVATTFLRTWRDDRALLRCELRLRGCLAVFLARIESVLATEVRLRADDEHTALVFPLLADSLFLYGDMRDSPDLHDKYDSTLMWVVSYEDSMGGAYEAITLGELRHEK